MANNRMGIRCKNCGSVYLLAKTYLQGYYISNLDTKDTLYDNLNNFFDEHSFCSKELNERDIRAFEPKFIKKDYNEENSFELCYETYWGDDKE
jgi:hypothetical protein